MSDPEKKPRPRIIKKKGHGGHHGGAWKVAYADFVTAMMALFLVLWLVSQADTKLKQAIAQYFRSPGVFDSQRGGILEGPKKVSKEPATASSQDEEQTLFGVAKELKKEFATRPEFSAVKDQIKIDVTSEGLRIQIVDKAERVSFSSGSAMLTAEAKAVLAEIAHGICGLPNPLKIGGHTDRRTFPPGSVYTNWELSTDRANAARRELEANCVKPEMIRGVVGYADTELFVPDDPYSPSNRRISITVMRTAQTDAPEKTVGEMPIEIDGRKTTKTDGTEGEDAPHKAKDDGATNSIETKEGAHDGVKNAKEKDASAPIKPNKETREEHGGAAPSSMSSEQRLLKNKLATERAVSVGEADKLPSNVKRTREEPQH